MGVDNADIDRMTAPQLVAFMQGDSPLANARKVLSAQMASIEQSQSQKRVPNIIETRKMEFKAVLAIAQALGVEL